jgi:hypothetical protein
MTTVEFPAADGRTAEMPSPSPPAKPGFWREVSGVVTAGVLFLTAVVLVLQVVAWVQGKPGVGVLVLTGHLIGSVLVVLAQRQVDRRQGRPALLFGLGVGVLALTALVLFWWS